MRRLDGDDLFLAGFLLFVAAVLTAAVLGVIFTADEDWTQTEDPNCYLRTVDDARFRAPDIHIRERYCKENP